MVRPYAFENQFLLCCARLGLDDAAETRARQLAENNLDWSYLLQTAIEHGVGSLLYKSLGGIGLKTIPPAALATLRLYTQQVFVASSLMAQELLKVLAIFNAHNLYAIPYKGPALAVSAYGDLALRPFGDLDIWVPQHDMKKGKALLLSLGYQPGKPDEGQDDDAYIRTHHDYLFVRKNKNKEFYLELQWGVTEFSFSFPIAFQPLWERRQTVSLLGRDIPNLCIEDALLILCIHGTKHGWSKLMWTCDIAELLRSQPHIDWPYLLQKAEKLGGRRMLFFGLHLANTLLGAPLPQEILQKIGTDPLLSALARQVQEGLFRGESDPSSILEEKPFFYLKLRERWQDRMQLFFRYFPDYVHRMITPNEQDHMFCPLPKSLSFLYYVLRPVRLVGAYARHRIQLPQRS